MNIRKLTRIFAAVAAAVLAAALTPAVASAQSTTPQKSDAATRLWGPDRYATSLAVAEAVAADAGGNLSAAVLVSGRSWTDAVTAAPLAGTLGAPVLLADPRNGVTEDTKAFMEQVGVTRIVVIGSERNLPGDALGSLSGIDDSIERIAASNKYAMSAAVASEIGEAGSLGAMGRTAILASGEVFADALAAGPLAAKAEVPILLTDPATLPQSVSGWIDANADHVIVMGGNAAISQRVEDAVVALGKDTTRVGGKDRFETATLFAEFAADTFDGDCFDGTIAGLATGGVPADAYSSAPLLARLCAPLVLTYTQRVPEVTKIWLGVEAKQRLYVFGGTAAVAETAVAQARLRHWDHQALIDLPLWGHCPPEAWADWLVGYLDEYMRVWEGWDTEATEVDGHVVASGWWTDEQLALWVPGAGITAASARENAAYYPDSDFVSLWGDVEVTLMDQEAPPEQLPTLTAALRHRGSGHLDNFAAKLRATSNGVEGSGAWPSHIRLGRLLTSWMRFRAAQPPTTQEPVAWVLRSLFEARESGCVATALIAMCASDETPPPMLAKDHPIGRVLRSLSCGQ